MPISTIDEADQAISALQTTLQALMRKDIGLIVLSPSPMPPSDCIPCDGREYDITDPANTHLIDLFGVLGKAFGGDGVKTFKAPELRGEFLRVWDDGARPDGAVDPNRGLGSFQLWKTGMPRNPFITELGGRHGHTGHTGDESQSHNHSVNHNVLCEGEGPNRGDGGGDIGYQRHPSISVGNNNQGHTHGISEEPDHAHPVSGGDSETRPRNVALAAYIRF